MYLKISVNYYLISRFNVKLEKNSVLIVEYVMGDGSALGDSA
jgi:hypothetical protein